MKKHSIICFIMISAMFVLFACSSNKNSDFASSELNAPEPNNTDVILTIKESNIGADTISVDTEEITFIIENKSDKTYGYSKDVHLQKKINGKWTIIPTLENTAFEADLISISPSGIGELPFQISAFYGSLSAGKYRILKEIYLLDDNLCVIDTGYYIAAEFEIE
ncbi:MAG TPA: hypothetical protein PK629_10970 [Oscillospiraceae bacterium]|nr:hypothetical protein [Oscillospiraceae bacterium]HPF55985.1 hypothetical protein [Clostridiales bacterium]HPK36221.1 hypothetical protein [Oscillospiraceae bacterium]HPR75712.1 hypothetical protein [Oscillospiraceae bacterium]